MANNYQNSVDNLRSAGMRARGNFLLHNTKSNPEFQSIPEEQTEIQPSNRINISNQTRLNALDSTLLENEAYQDIEDENFKTEYKINKLEEQLKYINNEIESAKIINDEQKADILMMKRHALTQELNQLKQSYNNTDITTKLSDNITNFLSFKPTILSKFFRNLKQCIEDKFLSKISKKYNSAMDTKIALEKLTTLNKNMDEIITMQTPYGEEDEWYEKLFEYLNSANLINYQLNQTMGTQTFFDTINSIDKNKLPKPTKNQSNFGNMTYRKKN